MVTQQQCNSLATLMTATQDSTGLQLKSVRNAVVAEQAQAQTSGLPELTGSEKQINWATTIRAKFFAVLDDYTPQFMAIAVPGKEDAVKAMLDQYRDLLTSKTDCRYWIDNRDDMSYIGSVKDFAKYVSETLRNK